MDKERKPNSFSASVRSCLSGRMTSLLGVVIAGILVILALSSATQVIAAETQEIELTDGSVITGEVVSLSGGIYTIRSAALGTLRLEASKISVIRLRGSAAPGRCRGAGKVS